MPGGPIQTRSEEEGLAYFHTIERAMDYATRHPSVWKVSFWLGQERVRLVKIETKGGSIWKYEPIDLLPYLKKEEK